MSLLKTVTSCWMNLQIRQISRKAVMVDKIWGRNDGLAKSDIRVFDPYLKRQSIDPKIKNMIKLIQKFKNGHFDAKYSARV